MNHSRNSIGLDVTALFDRGFMGRSKKMPFVIKHQPFTLPRSGECSFRHLWRYEKCTPMRGARAFIWFARRTPLEGLVAAGVITRVSQTQRMSEIDVDVFVTRRASPPYYSISSLEPFRNFDGDSPEVLLARPLYYNSHSKIAEISESESAFLESHFKS